MQCKRDWKKYNKKLIRRGTVFIEENCFRNWEKELKKMNRRKEGHSYEYPDSFIKFIGILKMQFNLPYRKLNGFLLSFSQFFSVPDYTTIFRRINRLKLDISDSIKTSSEPMFISIDASGLRSDNGGAWLEKRFGRKKKRWIKIHFAVDVDSKSIVEFSVTTDRVHDNRRFRGLVRRASKKHNIDKVAADPGYDDFRNYELLHKKKIRPAIKPKLNSNPDSWTIKNQELRERGLHRLKQVLLFQKYSFDTWKKKTGYNYRTLSESVFSVFKKSFGHSVTSKKMRYVRNEIMLKAYTYNLML